MNFVLYQSEKLVEIAAELFFFQNVYGLQFSWIASSFLNVFFVISRKT